MKTFRGLPPDFENGTRMKDNPPARGLEGWAELLWLSRFFTFTLKC